jgi:SAM-dependent methyltransferase
MTTAGTLSIDSVADLSEHNRPLARTWDAGGSAYDRISRQIADAIEHAVDRLDPRPGDEVLDVATGTGWGARRIACRGASVVGVDLGEELIATAREFDSGGRAEYRVGDADALPFAESAFDGVISTFGVMFSRRPELAAAELARVCRPGGRLVLATWAADGRVREMFELIRRYASEVDESAPSPFAWGDTTRLVDLLGADFDLGFEQGTSYYREIDGAAAFRTFAAGFGPLVSLLRELPKEAAESLRREFELFHERHRTGIGVLLPREYLITFGRRRA